MNVGSIHEKNRGKKSHDTASLIQIKSTAKLYNSVITNKKKPPFSPFTIMISLKINNLYSFQKMSFSEILPPHTPFTTLQMRTVNATT